MSEIHTPVASELATDTSIEVLFEQLLELEPKPIANFVPTNAAEQRSLFLSGEIRNPNHEYAKLSNIDFEANRRSIQKIGDELVAHPDIPEKYEGIDGPYGQFVQNYVNKTAFMETSNRFNTAETPEEKDAARADFMKTNIELFGEPDQATYRSLLSEKLAKITTKELSASGSAIRQELLDLVGNIDTSLSERFRPSAETMEWTKTVVESLYGSLLQHVPDQEKFIDQDIKSIFEDILADEFGDSAKGWEVIIDDAQSINVKSAEKKLVIPHGREVNLKTMRGLVVHEIGVHFMRSVMGEQTDLLPFKLGLSQYYDTEEGTGSVVEQALEGEYVEAGADHYITAGLAYYDKKDFRDVYEIKWRLALLSGTKGDPSDEAIAKAQAAAYGSTMRIMRGTDELPWFKDLSYYNGSAEVWKHLESIVGDDLEFTFVLLGKGNPANTAHKRIMLETATPSRDDDPTEEEAAKV